MAGTVTIIIAAIWTGHDSARGFAWRLALVRRWRVPGPAGRAHSHQKGVGQGGVPPAMIETELRRDAEGDEGDGEGIRRDLRALLLCRTANGKREDIHAYIHTSSAREGEAEKESSGTALPAALTWKGGRGRRPSGARRR